MKPGDLTERVDQTAMVYMSLLSTDNFLPGVLVLYYSLTKTAPQHKFVLLVTEDVSEQARCVLNALKITTFEVENRTNPGGLVIDRNEHMPHWDAFCVQSVQRTVDCHKRLVSSTFGVSLKVSQALATLTVRCIPADGPLGCRLAKGLKAAMRVGSAWRKMERPASAR